jgi:hypothetical protein
MKTNVTTKIKDIKFGAKEDVREGIRGSISRDGTVNVDRESDDPNQLTIDETEVFEGEEDDEELAELSMEELDEEDRLDDRHEDNDGPMIPDDDELPY